MRPFTSLTPALVALSALAISSGVQAGTFPDFGFKPSDEEYTGKLFTLSQDYPKQLPTELPAFFKQLPKDFSNDFESWREYMTAVKDYCLEGNLQKNWTENPVRGWYHMPWQHYGPMGREAINGLTKEAQIQKGQLAASQTTTGQTYAVGVYNDFGGYTIGQVWQDPQNPDPSHTAKPHSFPNGTVVCKALFADVDRSQVPFLQNPVLWKGYITDTYESAKRVVRDVALIQMDIAVRDTRVKETGWLFGTFQYNGENAKAASWDNLVPVGIMWGNDPEDTQSSGGTWDGSKTPINQDLKETAINAKPELPPTHLGWNGRLNGPVDNPVSSCLSCHMTAEAPQLAIMNPTFQSPNNQPAPGSAEWMKWFANIPAGESFSALYPETVPELAKGTSTFSTDYSLQLAIGIQNFYDWKCNQSGVFVNGDNLCKKTGKLKGQRLGTTPSDFIQPIRRDGNLSNLQ